MAVTFFFFVRPLTIGRDDTDLVRTTTDKELRLTSYTELALKNHGGPDVYWTNEAGVYHLQRATHRQVLAEAATMSIIGIGKECRGRNKCQTNRGKENSDIVAVKQNGPDEFNITLKT